jgi:hypothetical protein
LTDAMTASRKASRAGENPQPSRPTAGGAGAGCEYRGGGGGGPTGATAAAASRRGGGGPGRRTARKSVLSATEMTADHQGWSSVAIESRCVLEIGVNFTVGVNCGMARIAMALRCAGWRQQSPTRRKSWLQAYTPTTRIPQTYGHRLLAGFAWSGMHRWVRAARLTTNKTLGSRKAPPTIMLVLRLWREARGRAWRGPKK